MTCDCVVPNITPQTGNGLIYLYTMDDGKQYVGQTTMSISRRHTAHKCDDNLVDRYICTHSWNLQVIGEYPEEQLDDMEKHFIKQFNTMSPNGLNLEDGGNVNKHMSDESKKKMSVMKKGKTSPRKGITLTEEQKKKVSENTKKAMQSEEIRSKISESKKGKEPWNKGKKGVQKGWNKGMHRSEETRKKISESLKGKVTWNIGRKHSEKSIQKMRESHRGHVHTEEQKRKISESVKRAIAAKKAIQ